MDLEDIREGQSVEATITGTVHEVYPDNSVAVKVKTVLDMKTDTLVEFRPSDLRLGTVNPVPGQMYRNGLDVFVVYRDGRLIDYGEIRVMNVYTGKVVDTAELRGATLIADSEGTD